ncbi:MAG: single-stranded-DNA-specific exonuclease RecJ [Planctomycetota bacterium]|nr:single-stranded-DNA-specific exonuclease RecJ [Planctomycetota bacterium]
MTPTNRRWVQHPQRTPEARALASELGSSPVIAQILMNRGLKSLQEMRAFLSPSLNSLHDPGLLPDIEPALARIDDALAKGQRIVVYGDYDVDGISATALLLRFFRLLGRDAGFYIPQRLEEGYSLNINAIEKLANEGASLIITVDCGTCDVAVVERARQLGVDVLITDHHEQGNSLPPAVAIVNPKRRDSRYPFRDLSGVGVAFKLVWAFAQRLSNDRKVSEEFRDFLIDSVGLVALGTVADVVPLLDENRVFAHYGLKALATCENPGIRALIRVSDLEGKEMLTHHVGFRLGPRLNAGGRLGSPYGSVELLATATEPRSSELALALDRANKERRRIEAEIFQGASQMLKDDPAHLDGNVIVLANETWHCGVLGIVASKLMEQYYRPVILISFDSGEGRGSGRSIPGFHLQQALISCQQTMVSCGGHAMAAGLRIRPEQVPVLREKLNAYARENLSTADLTPALQIDDEISLAAVTKELVQELARLEPCGVGNRTPMFLSRGLQIAGDPQVMGTKGEHLQFVVSQGPVSLRAVAFGSGALRDRLVRWKSAGEKIALVHQPALNTWRNMETVELRVKDFDIDASQPVLQK